MLNDLFNIVGCVGQNERMGSLWAGDVFYVIEEGTFTIFKTEGQELARVSKGSCFGELALLRQVHYPPPPPPPPISPFSHSS